MAAVNMSWRCKEPRRLTRTCDVFGGLPSAEGAHGSPQGLYSRERLRVASRSASRKSKDNTRTYSIADSDDLYILCTCDHAT